MKIRDDGKDHTEGDASCGSCAMTHPRTCECGGLIHGEMFWDEDDSDIQGVTMCDKCGRVA